MTELLSKEFSRTSFLKGGGALVVAIGVAGAGGKTAKGAVDPFESLGPYDAQAIDSWIAIHADNTATIKFGKVELGQGTGTGLLMIAAEELDLAMSQVKYATHDTNVTTNQGGTTGSNGISGGGPQVRAAAVAARSALLDLAAANLGVAKASLTVSNGVVSGGGKTVKYGDLLGDKVFNVRMPSAPNLAAGAPGTKPISQYKIVGTHVPRVDIPDKVTGKFVYTQNVRVPGMLHGRVVRPRGQGAYGKGTAPEILSVDESSIKSIPGVQVVRYKNFLGVVAPTEYAAIQAAAQLKVTWADPPALPGVGNLFKQMREQDSAGLARASIAGNTGNFDTEYANAPIKVSQSYKFHYQGGMAMGPECCVAHVTPQGARIFSNTQDAYGLRGLVQSALAQVMTPPLAANRIRVTYYEGGSVYGPTAPYVDAAQAAAVMSALVGKPVRVQFMRWDTHGWNHYGPPLLADVRGGVSANGDLKAYEFTGFTYAYYSTDPTLQQVRGIQSGDFSTGAGQFHTTINGQQYNVAGRRLINKTLPLENNAFKMRHLRAPLTPQTAFAAEQFVDELAYAAKMDPVEFRRRNIANTASDPSQRWKNVLEGVATLSGWKSKVAASSLSNANVVSGRGFSFGFYSNSPAAGVVDIEVNKKTGKISVKHIYAVLDAGYIVNPDGLHNNEEGAAIQGVSRALHEQVRFDKRTVTSTDWVSYPILRFVDAPKITLHGLQRTDVPINDTTTVAANGSRSTGAGEPAVTPIAAAIGNAFFDATGLRIREAPMTPGRVRAVLRAAGK